MKVLRIVLIAVTLAICTPLAILYAGFRASLPQLDGSARAAVVAPVTISRDALGTPTIEAANRVDLAYATGYVHAQDRFFQMDLSRRLAAGELSELFGRLALEQDESARLFRFRSLARQVLANATAEQHAIVEAYARGVNAGLASLRSRPFEYWVLQAQPAPWKPEDVALVSYAMWWDLQHDSIRREMLRAAVNARLGGETCGDSGAPQPGARWKCALTFFYPRGTSWDSPNSASEVAPSTPPIRIPTPDELNVRAQPAPASAWRIPERSAPVGSNGWAVSGQLTNTGAALVASDMHLSLRVPTIWYRARFKTGTGATALDATGLTLPGAPIIVAGSNGEIAWGFTNSYGDYADVTLVPCTHVDDTSLRTPNTTTPLTSVRETIHVKGEADVSFAVRYGAQGVLYDTSPERGRCVFARWLAAVPGATNFNILALENAASVAQALALAPTLGIPHQNLNVGDRRGHIGWSTAGRLPAATGEERLAGAAPWTTEDTHPRLLDPPGGRVWTANARPIDDPRAEALIGGDEAMLGSEYDLGARAHQIHDDLLAIKRPASPADMLRVQLDDRAVFLTRWRDLLVALLDEEAVRGHPQRAELKRIVSEWRARASVDSVGYRLVRAYHSRTERAAWSMFVQGLGIDAADAPPPSQFEGALWEVVVHEQPMHLLAARYESWHDFLLEQVDATLAELEDACPRLDVCKWGQRRPVSIRHPLSRALAFASRLLDMPTLELPGDHDMPRVQDGAFGASERFAVSPGHETEGYLQTAGGQSGHPLSPYYRTGFSEWAEGKPLPFLPGRAEHTLTLRP
ncbi:MAG TPA: penicillin acylase family protein [Steroidobacteraceae bacterium]|nr:penicillin acylase family protein [Steroidobacteraceae bacterium]